MDKVFDFKIVRKEIEQFHFLEPRGATQLAKQATTENWKFLITFEWR